MQSEECRMQNQKTPNRVFDSAFCILHFAIIMVLGLAPWLVFFLTGTRSSRWSAAADEDSFRRLDFGGGLRHETDSVDARDRSRQRRLAR
jgi:hypothetical protein